MRKTCAKWHPRIEAAIRKAHSKATKEGTPFKLSMTALAKELSTSRPTLYKHEPFIEALLHRLKAERRRVDGQAAIDLLQDQLHRKDQKISELEARNAALMRDLQNIFDHIYGASVTAGELVEAVVRKRSNEDGRCVLCEAPVEGIPPRKNNVVKLSTKDST
ncbi:hypothetical protein GG681_09100 [Epibacterium sp. SM1969]|uniref:Uncharacterized protein n=1 Tax=Tritonibacter aquimaris TaxID=2663379 RepID=A0A844ASS6_9RHOB|nr:hypothetical protein [Tritonibacter aquimaris]MQY42797.1 hypothetical protein [Tritonibacter aquimaris]